MSIEISEWNGFPVRGDVSELDGILEATGIISLDKEDIENVLTGEGENWVSIGTSHILDKAFKEAINALPCRIDRVSNLLIDFRYGIKQPKMSDLSSITAMLSHANDDIDIRWGLTSDDSLGDTFKVTLVASIKA